MSVARPSLPAYRPRIVGVAGMKRILWAAGGIAAAWAIACVFGAVIALGPARIARGDVSALSVAASLCALSCCVALVWLALRAAKRWWARAVVIVIALPLVAVTALPPAVAVWAVYPSYARETHSAPPGAANLSIECTRGATLAAWYLPSKNGAAVVLAHGAGSTRGATIAHAEVLADAGYGVLMLDARGHGGSTGAAMDLGWWGDDDLRCAVDALVTQPDVDAQRIGVVGLSMGAEQALGAAAADPRVRAVVAEGATQRTAADKDGWLPRGVGGWIQRRMDSARDLLVAAMTPAPRPGTLRTSAMTTDADVLLIVAGTVADESRAAEWISDANPRVEVLTIAGASHTGGLSADRDLWTQTVLEFLDEALAS